MSKEVKKELNGKEFVASLEGCRSSQDIFELLDKTMDKDTLKTACKMCGTMIWSLL